MINVVHFTSYLCYHIPVENGGNQLLSVAIGGDADDMHGGGWPTAKINTC